MASQTLNDQTFSRESIALLGAPSSSRTMSIGGVAVKALFFIVLTAVSASFGWQAAENEQPSSGMWFFLGYVLLLGLSVAAARNPRMAAVAGTFYSLFMGFWMGSISALYEEYYDGIVAQAVLASVATFIGSLVLYALRIVKVTAKFVSILMIAMSGLVMLWLFGLFFSLFGFDFGFYAEPNGIGIAISVGICLLAAMNLLVDFAVVEQGTKAGAPKEMEWLAAFGLITTLVWLYTEILRLLALLQSRQ